MIQPTLADIHVNMWFFYLVLVILWSASSVLLNVYYIIQIDKMTSSNGNIFQVTGPLFGDFTSEWPVNFLHKDQWRGALMFSLICAWIYSWVNNREAGDLRRHHAHYDFILMSRNQLCRSHDTSWWNQMRIEIDYRGLLVDMGHIE